CGASLAPGNRDRHRPARPAVIAFDEITAARERIAGPVLRTPLVRLQVPEAPAEIYLKLENLQPIGSFKLRGALNAVKQIPPGELAHGVVTASAGNMGQGVAWAARELGVPCTVVVPESAAETKVAAIERLGGTVVPVDDVAAAVRLLVNRARIVAEGAGALALAAALAGRGGTGKVVCVVSGGNIDEAKLRTILSGATP